MSRIMVDAKGIRKSFGQQVVLDELDLCVEEGTITALLGPNGAGKTTLVRILGTLTRPDAGTATVGGYDVTGEPAAARSIISLTGQYAALDELLTGEENLLLAARLWKIERSTGRTRTRELLERFDLIDAARKPVKTYSGGMRRKLDLAMGLMGTPRVLFLDEPTTGLDPRSRNELWQIVKEMVSSGATILLTTQYLEEADRLADRITMIDHGRVIAEGAADELKRDISRDVVELWFPDHRTRTRALLALRDQPMMAATNGQSVRITTDGSAAHVHVLLSELHAAQVPVDRIAVHRPTLDDVFLSMTSQQPIGMEVHH